MKKLTLAGLAVLFAMAFTPITKADLFPIVDMNPDPNIIEIYLSSVEKDVTINSTNVHAFVFKDEMAAVPPASAGIPIPVIKAKVGDLIICHYTNKFTVESASIHWHGIELDNDSDGTAVTQDAVLPGQAYTYRFETFRPGTFWFHSHMLPGNTLFGGMYGVLIIENTIEASLVGTVLPDEANTHILAMSDIEFNASGTVGKGGTGISTGHPSPNDKTDIFATENELIEICHLFGTGDGTTNTCSLSTRPGDQVLVNGVANSAAPTFIVPSGKRVRLRLLNESISRHFRLRLLNSGNTNLYRIGGQGGLLDNVRIEGGTLGTWNTQFGPGEILLGSGVRADVIVCPTGPEGSTVTLMSTKASGSFQISTSLPDNPIAYFQISGTSTDVAPAAGDAILAGTAEDIENIRSGPVASFIDPAPDGGSANETITLTTATPTGPGGAFAHNQPAIEQWASVLDSNLGNGDWLLVPKPPIARYAHVGDLLELTVRNDTDAAHPYHLHGFSMQPVSMTENGDPTKTYTFDYDEFLDTIDVHGHQTYVFRVRVDDRAKFCDQTPNAPPDAGPVLAECTANPCGGVVGRWLYHCHIVSHGALGMIGEITILPGVDTPPTITCPADITQSNDPGLCSAVVTFADPTTTDDCGEVTVVCDPTSGSVFPVGTTVVHCTATDSIGQTAECTFNVTVKDTEKPKITSSVTTTTLSSPNHDMINVGFSASATDNCSGPVTLSFAVYSDEDDEVPTGDGNFSPDAKDIGVGTLRLRSERSGNLDGRVYLIIITATDGAGNVAKAAQTVVVAKANAEKWSTSVNAQALLAKTYVETNGVPPPGFFVVGDGAIIGTKQ
jgi:FtsP/CotA-like multicopper oxidase with cupredoxin domain